MVKVDFKLIDDILTHFDESDWIGRWLNPGAVNSMAGTSSDVIFGDAAVTHMDDVKSVMSLGKWASILSAFLLPLLIAYVIWRRREMGRIALQYSLIFFGALLHCLAE